MINLYNSSYNYFDKYDTGYECWWHSLIVPQGFLSKQGQIVLRSSYQQLLHFAESNNLIITEEEWINQKKYGFFSYGDNKTTFRLPDDRGVYYCHYDSSYHGEFGKFQEDTLQGHGHNVTKGSGTIGGGGGSGTLLSHGGNWINATEPITYLDYGVPRFAQRTQPRTMTCLRIIKY